MNRRLMALPSAAAIALLVVLPLQATAGNGGKGAEYAGACTVSGNMVRATGLPTDAVVNFMLESTDYEWSFALGFTDGTAWVEVPERTSYTSYKFTSETFGKGGKRYWTYASCWAS
jgi:hypothetical protein